MTNNAISKISHKSLHQQIDVVAEFHAHKIQPERIAYRTGIAIELVTGLVAGTLHQARFKHALARHKRARRDQRLKKSLRQKGIAQAALQDQIEAEYQQSLQEL